MFYDDSNDYNWKNSEIMTIFADHLPMQATELETNLQQDSVAGKTADHTMNLAEPVNEELDYEKYAAVQGALGAIDGVVSGLRKLASEAGKNGHIKEAYLIERALEDISDVGYSLWRDR